MDNVVASTIIIGIINAVNKQFPQVSGLYGIALAVALGAVAGYYQFAGITNVENGILVGFSAVGIYKVAQKIGNS